METAPPSEDGSEERAGEDRIELRVNGNARAVAPGLTVAELLEELEVDGRRVAVERNERIVPRDERPRTELEDGDVVEIVQFVGGGR